MCVYLHMCIMYMCTCMYVCMYVCSLLQINTQPQANRTRNLKVRMINDNIKDTKKIKGSSHINNPIAMIWFMPGAKLSYSLGSRQELGRPRVRTTRCLILQITYHHVNSSNPYKQVKVKCLLMSHTPTFESLDKTIIM